MIATLRGRLSEKGPRGAVVDVGGVGYDVVASAATLASLPDVGAEVALFVHTHVREDALALFGFASREEREAFRLLLGVSGVGPKVAVAILSGLAPREIARAVAEKDVAKLSRVNGVGKKTAERIAIDLRGKLAALSGATGPDAPVGAVPGAAAQPLDDVVMALVKLGYSAGEAERAAERLKDRGALPVETLLRDALQLVRRS